MTTILTDLAPESVIRANQSNLHSFLCSTGLTPDAYSFENNLLTRWQTPVNHSWFNGVLSKQAPPQNATKIVDEQIAYFQSHNVNAISWWLAPELAFSDWESILSARGFVRDSDRYMALDLNNLVDVTDIPPGLRIAAVNDAEILRIGAHTLVQGFGMPPEWEPAVTKMLGGQGYEWPVRIYLAWLDGIPVATATVYLAEGVAGVVNVATLPEYRRKGIGAAVTAAPLRDARALGYRVATLQASDMGAGVYRRLGFEYECMIDHFLWKQENAVS